MAKSNLDRALAYTFVNEGGFSNHPADHGGATSQYGIIRSELARWRKRPVTVAEVRDMSAQEAKDIYEAWYWKPVGCDKINSPGVAMCMFDIAVVMGIGIPPKFAQAICNAHGSDLVLDGHVGPKTIAAINALDPKVFIRDFSAKAEARFRGIVANNSSQGVFLKGWLNRAHRLLTLVTES
jgi:lysozyme family protein